MSTFSQFGVDSYADVEIGVDESTNIYETICEGYQAEQDIFNSIIGRDFQEAYANAGAMNESAMEAINEASIREVGKKIADFFRKIAAKIMGILKSFRDKIVSVFIRDGKELYKKYSKQVSEKINKGTLSNMKYKVKEFNKSYMSSKGELKDNIMNTVANTSAGKDLSAFCAKMAVSKIAYEKGDPTDKSIEDAGKEFKPLTEDQKSNYKEALYSALAGSSCTAKDFAKTYQENVFKDVEDKEGFGREELSTCKEVLESGKKVLDQIKKEETAVKKHWGDLIKSAEKIQKAMNKDLSSDKYNYNAAKTNALASNIISLGNIISAASIAGINQYATAVKADLKQWRGIFMKAATFNGKKAVDEQAALLESVAEVSDFEVEEMFEI